MISAIDGGNFKTAFYDGKKLLKFPSVIGMDFRERNLKQQHGEHDYEWEYEHQRGFAGTLAQYESEYPESRMGESKAHFDAKLRVLIALHQFTDSLDHQIVVGQPISTHTEEEKAAIKKMFIGKHDLTVNGKRKVIVIQKCEVAAEGVSSGLLIQNTGKIRIIDIGSGTVNFGTLINKRFNDLGSFTLASGMETMRYNQIEAFARQIALKAFSNGWNKEDAVYLCGGGAEVMMNLLQMYFSNVQLLQSEPEFCNVKAFYLIARKLYG